MKAKRNSRAKFLCGALVLTAGSLVAPGCKEKAAPTGEIDLPEHRIYFIGDAGLLSRNPPRRTDLFDFFRGILDRETIDNTLVYLGDNIYHYGLPLKPPRRSEKEEVLRTQIAIGAAARTRHIFFLPGNHDWDDDDYHGEALERIVAQTNFIRRESSKARLVPACGCPDPVTRAITADVSMVFLDTQAMLYLVNEKVGLSATFPERAACLAAEKNACRISNRAEFIAELNSISNELENKHMILAAHHPMKSCGPHGGSAALDQDVLHPDNRKMTDLIKRGLGAHRALAFFAGHDHSLQVMDGNSSVRYFLVSGSGSKLSSVSTGKDVRFALSRHGLMRLNLYKKKISLEVLLPPGSAPDDCEYRNEEVCVIYSRHLAP